jgi:hypothetical protein
VHKHREVLALIDVHGSGVVLAKLLTQRSDLCICRMVRHFPVAAARRTVAHRNLVDVRDYAQELSLTALRGSTDAAHAIVLGL